MLHPKLVQAIIGVVVILIPMYFVVQYQLETQCQPGVVTAKIGIYTHSCPMEK